jgi:alpha-glucosidase
MATPPWWQRGAVYQVYPRSFADGDGDGVGDLRGLRAHLDHLTDLRVEAVWLSPIFPSPMADFGYDVADFCDVDPLFGTLDELDELITDCHERGIRVVLDWVPNHSSDQHPWFRASRSSRDAPERDWYVWRDGVDGGPPNDWRSEFAAIGPAWTFDDHTGQWYLHSFTPQQPDLNWSNPEVEAAMHDVVRFWLDRGVDGLRIDALQRLTKDPLLRSNAGSDRRHDQDWEPVAHDRLRAIRRVVDEYPDRMIVGEVYLLDLRRVVDYLSGGDQLHLAHNFVFLHLPWDAAAFRSAIEDFEALAEPDAWPAWFLGNHDHSRIATRYDEGGGSGQARARAVAVMLTALRGTPFLYQGDELGLPDAEIPPDRVVDVDGRDPERAPLPWRPPSVAGPGAGFTTGEPWLPLVRDAEELCVERQAADPRSTLSLVRRLGELRAGSPALQSGRQHLLDAGPDVLAWLRIDGSERLLAAVNFAVEPRRLLGSSGPDGQYAVLLSTDVGRAETTGSSETLSRLMLQPSEAVLLQLLDPAPDA